VRETQVGEAAKASDELSDKAKSVGQDEEPAKEPKEAPRERPAPKMVEPDGGMPARPPRVEKPRTEVERDTFRPPPALKQDDRRKEDKNKRGKNG
jgi:hypothetical protein